jgi:hypothetical protein
MGGFLMKNPADRELSPEQQPKSEWAMKTII